MASKSKMTNNSYYYINTCICTHICSIYRVTDFWMRFTILGTICSPYLDGFKYRKMILDYPVDLNETIRPLKEGGRRTFNVRRPWQGK